MIKAMGKTTSYGMWKYGNTFRQASISVLAQQDNHPSMPYYFLAGQSFELLLKAFLMGRGVSLEDLRKYYGHNLQLLLKESRRRKLGKEVELKPHHVGVIDLLNLEYKPRRFQYYESGNMYLPDLQFLIEANEKLALGLEVFCSNMTAKQLSSNKVSPAGAKKRRD